MCHPPEAGSLEKSSVTSIYMGLYYEEHAQFDVTSDSRKSIAVRCTILEIVSPRCVPPSEHPPIRKHRTDGEADLSFQGKVPRRMNSIKIAEFTGSGEKHCLLSPESSLSFFSSALKVFIISCFSRGHLHFVFGKLSQTEKQTKET